MKSHLTGQTVRKIQQLSLIIFVLSLLKPNLSSANLTAEELINNELIRQQQQQQQIKQKLEPTPDVRIPQPEQAPILNKIPTDETPCFPIEHIILKGEHADEFSWALKFADIAKDKSFDPAENRCLGSSGINLVMTRIQNAIIERGYVTTRVLAEPQNLADGELTLTLIPGKINNISFTPDANGTINPRGTLINAIPFKEGDILNLRDIEQALENFKRIPTAEADIQITPAQAAGAQPGESDLLITWNQTFPFRVNLNLDDSGSDATGKYQGGLTISYDHWWTLNDLFYISYNRDLGGGAKGKRGTNGHTIHYSIPYKYWLLSLDSSDNSYYQSVPGLTQTNLYSGDSATQTLKLSRLIYRDSQTKLLLSLSSWLRHSRNYIDDIEIEIQRRRMAGVDFQIDLTRFIKKATINLNFKYREGIDAFGALPAPEEEFDEGTSQPKIYNLNFNYNTPIKLNNQQLIYANQIRLQKNVTPLIPQDRFSIGGRYTVRGFDGALSLSAESGWLIRNDLDLFLGKTQQRLFIGLDHGEVSGRSAKYLLGKTLTGGVIGLRGNLKTLNYELFAGAPIKKPTGFQTSTIISGFNIFLTF